MPKTTQSTPRPKAQTTLSGLRYDSATAIKSMNSYEKMLLRREQSAKAAGVKSLRKNMGMEAGFLTGLFAIIH